MDPATFFVKLLVVNVSSTSGISRSTAREKGVWVLRLVNLDISIPNAQVSKKG